jgi:hypothetical protein
MTKKTNICKKIYYVCVCDCVIIAGEHHHVLLITTIEKMETEIHLAV